MYSQVSTIPGSSPAVSAALPFFTSVTASALLWFVSNSTPHGGCVVIATSTGSIDFTKSSHSLSSTVPLSSASNLSKRASIHASLASRLSPFLKPQAICQRHPWKSSCAAAARVLTSRDEAGPSRAPAASSSLSPRRAALSARPKNQADVRGSP